MLVPEAPRLGELHPVACARARASLPHSAAAGRWPLIYGRSPPSQPVPAVTSLFPKIKVVGETSRPIFPEARTIIPTQHRVADLRLVKPAGRATDAGQRFGGNQRR